jgi:hypothetical protein
MNTIYTVIAYYSGTEEIQYDAVKSFTSLDLALEYKASFLDNVTEIISNQLTN